MTDMTKSRGPVRRAEGKPVLQITGLKKTYFLADRENGVTVFSGLDLVIDSPRIIAIMGESGTGKTTLLNLIGLLDIPTSGEIRYGGLERNEVGDPALFRREKIGFVFQNHLLQEEFTAVENVALPVFLRTNDLQASLRKAAAILKEVGLERRLDHKPGELSGGENQRAAIARALVHDPEIVLADEPTGNLDFANQENVNELFIRINRKYNKTVIVATHNEDLARLCHEVYVFQKGKLVRRRK